MNTDDEPVEKFCPSCFDYRPGDVEDGTWSCPACPFADAIERVPHDVDEWRDLQELLQ